MIRTEITRSSTHRSCACCRAGIRRGETCTAVTLEHTETVPYVGEHTLRRTWHVCATCAIEHRAD